MLTKTFISIGLVIQHFLEERKEEEKYKTEFSTLFNFLPLFPKELFEDRNCFEWTSCLQTNVGSYLSF